MIAVTRKGVIGGDYSSRLRSSLRSEAGRELGGGGVLLTESEEGVLTLE